MGNIFAPPTYEHRPIVEVTHPEARPLIFETPPRTARPTCMHYSRGACARGYACRFLHDGPVHVTPVQRSRGPCRFFANGHCKKGNTCTFSHAQSESINNEESKEEHDVNDDDLTENWTRELGGAWAIFDDGAMVKEISLPSDFSAIRISNLATVCSVNYVVDLLSDVGMHISANDVRLIRLSDKCTAIIRVKDPAFSKTACSRLRTCITIQNLDVVSVPVPVPKDSDFHEVDCRQVHCSWHRPSRTVCLAYENQGIAFRVHKKFSAGKYKVAGCKVIARPPIAQSKEQDGAGWMIRLTGLAETVTEQHITQDMLAVDKPRRIEMGEPSYVADMEMDSSLIQSMLYEFGPLERWDISKSDKGKRIKVQATFMEESQARDAASSLDKKPLPFCETGKLFVELIMSVRFKVSTRVYDAVQERIKSHKESWARKYIHVFAFPPRGRYRILKMEGKDRQLVAQAQKDLEHIISGEVMRIDGKNLWATNLKINRDVYKRLKKIEDVFGVVIVRNVLSSQFRIFGPEDKYTPATQALHGLIQDVESDNQQTQLIRIKKKSGCSQADCPICLGEVEEPIRTSCNHVYCSLCFINMCHAQASQTKEFCITCEGNSGHCGKLFGIAEIQTILLSETFEDILGASFASHVRRHPDQFRYCPTPDCSQIYRVASGSSASSTKFTCVKCLASTCTTCHISHPGVSCGKHKGGESNDLEALSKIKEELGIKDCPKCSTAIEKTEGCNHMTCRGCGTHICWICQATFDTDSPCYEHMRRLHGGIGIE